MISILGYESARNTVKKVPLKQLKSFLSRTRNLVWVDLDRPTKADYKILSDIFHFHPLSIEDAEKPQTLPKIDSFPNYLFIVFHKVVLDPHLNTLDQKEIDFFLGRNFLVTVHHYDSFITRNNQEFLLHNPDMARLGADFILHRIVDSIVDIYLPILDKWEDDIDTMEERIFRKKLKGVLEETLRTRRHIAQFRRIIAPQREILHRLARRDSPFISPKAGIYFRDVYDHLTRCHQNLELNRETLHAAFEAYLSIISNHMAESSNRLNKVMQRLTIISTVFLPLTFLAGVYGMNFEYMPELNWRYGYFIIWSIFIALGAWMIYMFKKRKWMQ